jgi:uncharacterized protein involved in exopolysaccharide biosynthesis
VSAASAEWQDEQVVDLRALFGRLYAGRWLIVGCVAASTLAFAAAALVIKPQYRAVTVLAPSDANSGNLDSKLGDIGGLASLAGIELGSRDKRTEESLAVMRSRTFTEAFIRDKALMPKLFARKWDSRKGAWKVAPDEQPTPYKAFKRFNKIRSVSVDKKTGLVSVQIDWTDRNEAAAWANELVQRLNVEMRSRAIRDAEASLGFLEREEKVMENVTTRAALSRLIETQLKQRMLATVTEEYAFRFVDRALPADADDPVWPKLIPMILAGLACGVVLGCFAVLLLAWWRAPNDSAALAS